MFSTAWRQEISEKSRRKEFPVPAGIMPSSIGLARPPVGIQAVDDLKGSAVAADGENPFIAACRGFAPDLEGVPGVLGDPDIQVVDPLFQELAHGGEDLAPAPAAGVRVQYEQGFQIRKHRAVIAQKKTASKPAQTRNS